MCCGKVTCDNSRVQMEATLSGGSSLRGLCTVVSQLLRLNWLLGILLSAGLALRIAAQLAYRPALLYIDSAKYLRGFALTWDQDPGDPLRPKGHLHCCPNAVPSNRPWLTTRPAWPGRDGLL